jgi:hypothetical protein
MRNHSQKKAVESNRKRQSVRAVSVSKRSAEQAFFSRKFRMGLFQFPAGRIMSGRRSAKDECQTWVESACIAVVHFADKVPSFLLTRATRISNPRVGWIPLAGKPLVVVVSLGEPRLASLRFPVGPPERWRYAG